MGHIPRILLFIGDMQGCRREDHHGACSLGRVWQGSISGSRGRASYRDWWAIVAGNYLTDHDSNPVELPIKAHPTGDPER